MLTSKDFLYQVENLSVLSHKTKSQPTLQVQRNFSEEKSKTPLMYIFQKDNPKKPVKHPNEWNSSK
jgi:hypothetical protein